MTETAVDRGAINRAHDGVDALIEHRAKEAKERERWDASARAYAGQVRDKARREWIAHYCNIMARLHARLAREH